MDPSSNSSPQAGPLGLIYVLERFPGGTLNFVYNEISSLEKLGLQVQAYSLLKSEYVPSDARQFQERTRNVRPVGLGKVLRAWFYYLLRRPGTLLSLLLGFSLDNRHGRLRKAGKTLGHLVYSVYFAWLIRDDHRHIHAHFAFKAATAAYVASRLNGNTFSFTAHGSATVMPGSRFSLRSKIRRARFVVAVSRYNKRIMLGLCPDYPAERILVNRTGVLLDQFPRSEARGPRGPGRSPRLICVATLYPVKNHEAMVRAVGLLKREGLTCRLELVGRDEVGIGDRLRALAEGLGVADQIVFHGAVDHGRIREMLLEADLALLTSHSEGVPVSLMEAMAVGVPVLGPRVTGVPELIEDGRSGLLIDPQDVPGIAAAIRALTDGSLDTAAMVQEARRTIETDYNMAGNAARLARHFQSELAGNT